MNIVIRIIIFLSIIGLAFQGFKALAASKKEPKVKEQREVITSVDVIRTTLSSHSTKVETFGTVRSKFETKISAQVSGKIIELSPQFLVGKKVRAGMILARLDPTDYNATLAQQQANLIIAQRSLDEEKIRAQQAKQDWIASGREISSASDFVLRKPQLSAAEATIDAVKAVIEKAKADIERTKITAPFDAIVSSRTVSLGDFSTPQAILGSLISSAQAEIYLPLTAEQNLQIMPSAETQITLSGPTSESLESWTAMFSRYSPTVDTKNQVSYLIATIDDPYGKNPLPVGTFVNASIPAKNIDKAYRVPESALVNDEHIWVVSAENKLVKTTATRLHSFPEGGILIKVDDKITEEINVVSRPLSTFRDEMKVLISDAQSPISK